MSTITENIIQQLKTLTLLEAAELVSTIETTFGVDASSQITTTGALNNDTSVSPIEEKTEFDLILEEVPADKKISILKVVRVLTGLGLKEAKEMVESAPKLVLKGMSKDVVKAAQKQLEEAGAKTQCK
jgi:large subunit ribosomal protein L7/L12